MMNKMNEMATAKYRRKHFRFWFLIFICVSKAFYPGIHPYCQRSLECNLNKNHSCASSISSSGPRFHDQTEMHRIGCTKNNSQRTNESRLHQEACLFRMKGLLCFTSWTAKLFYARAQLHDEDSRMQPVHDTFAHIGIVFDKILDSWLNNSVSPALEDGFDSTDTNDINNEKPTTRSLPTHGSTLIRMEGSNETAGTPEIVSTETPMKSTSAHRGKQRTSHTCGLG